MCTNILLRLIKYTYVDIEYYEFSDEHTRAHINAFPKFKINMENVFELYAISERSIKIKTKAKQNRTEQNY